jgi:hypothetical protein
MNNKNQDQITNYALTDYSEDPSNPVWKLDKL